MQYSLGDKFSEMRYNPKAELLSFIFDSIDEKEKFEANIPEELKEFII